MTQAINSIGTTFKKGINVIAEIEEITGIDIKGETIDVTTLSSTNGYKEFILGFKDAGEVQIKGNFYPGDANGQKAMYTALTAGTVDSYTITFPTAMGATWTFDGYVTGFKTGATVNDTVTFDATVKLSGEPVLGVVASTGASAFVITQAGGTGLTAATWTPAFATGTTKYALTFTTQTAFVVKVTAASHTIKLYVDDVLTETLTTGVESASIAMAAIGSKKVTVKCWEVGKTPTQYDIMVGRIS
jgi:predicted secreted protein